MIHLLGVMVIMVVVLIMRERSHKIRELRAGDDEKIQYLKYAERV